MKTSLLISIYRGNTLEELNRCLKSIHIQKDIPNEIIFIIDGYVEDLVHIEIKKWSKILPIKIHELKENMGLAYALNYGMKMCTYDWVFRMDIDDVCAEDRFFKQKNIINLNPEIDILGGSIKCFQSFPNFFSGRIVPTSTNDIKNFMKYRNPMNHPTIFFNKNKILDIGGYPNARLGQDYLLWINAIASGLIIENTKDELVYMQVDKNSFSRRGLKNLKYDSYPYILMYKNKLTNIFEFLVGLSIRFIYCTYSSVRSIISI